MKKLLTLSTSLSALLALMTWSALAQSSTNFPAITVTTYDSNKVSPGYLFLDTWPVTTNYGSFVMILNNDGTPVDGDKYKELMTVAGDFKMLPNGMPTYAQEISPLRTGGGWNVKHEIVDETLTNVLETIQMGNGYLSEFHDFQLLPNGNALLEGYYLSEVDMSQIVSGGYPAALVSGGILQELDAQRHVIWQWRSWDHYNFADIVTSKNPVISEFHFNDLILDRDGNIIVGTPTEIRKINRQTGEVMWTLGGPDNEFTIAGTNFDATDFGGHGTYRLDNGNFLEFDNGRGPRSARAIEYSLDESNKIATVVWSYSPPAHITAFATGNAQRLSNGNTLICWGIPRKESGITNPVCTEVTSAGEKVFELSFNDTTIQSYRAFRFPFPTEDQQIVALQPELSPPNTYYFTNTGVSLEVTSGAGGYNQVSVTREPYAPLQPFFANKPPRVLPVRVKVTETGITSIDGEISFDAASFGFENPADLTVYYRPTPGTGLFVALPTAPYNPVSKQVSASFTHFGEFIFGYPDVAEIAFPPILNRPESYRGVQTNMVVAPQMAESNTVYTVNQDLPISLSWSPKGFAHYFNLQVADNDSFSNPVVDQTYQPEAFYVWTNALPNMTYYWRVRSLIESNGLYTAGGWSTGSFQTIPPALAVASPNGGELWQRGLKYYVQWHDNIQDDVSIELYKKGTFVSTIATNVPSTGVYQWEIGFDLDPGADYSIKITDEGDPSLFDSSDSDFNIDVPTIASIMPDPSGGMVLQWTGTSAGVYIEFSPTLSPGAWTQIAGPIAGSSWTNTSPPNADSGNYRLRLQ